MAKSKFTRWILMTYWHISISRKNNHSQSQRNLKRKRVKNLRLVASVKQLARLVVPASASHKLFIQKIIGRLLLTPNLRNSLKRPKLLSSRNLKFKRTQYPLKFLSWTPFLQLRTSLMSNSSQAWKNFQEDLKNDASRLLNSMRKNFALIIMRHGLCNCKPNFTYSTRRRIMAWLEAQALLAPSQRNEI